MINNWQKLTGKLDKQLVENAKNGIAVKYYNGITTIKLTTRSTLYHYNLSRVIECYQIL